MSEDPPYPLYTRGNGQTSIIGVMEEVSFPTWPLFSRQLYMPEVKW